MKQPLVSVLMAFYDDGKPETRKYCEEAIGSILAQTYRNFEVIFVVSGKRDFAEKQAKRSKRIRLFYLGKLGGYDQGLAKKISGLADARNFGIGKCRAELIMFADADDLSEPERMKKQVEFLLKHPKTGALGSSLRIMDGNGKTIAVRGAFEEDCQIKENMAFFNTMSQPSVMARKSTIKLAGGYRKVVCEDYNLWVRLLGKTTFANLREPLVSYRVCPMKGMKRVWKEIIDGTIATRRMAKAALGKKWTVYDDAMTFFQILLVVIPGLVGEERFERMRCAFLQIATFRKGA